MDDLQLSLVCSILGIVAIHQLLVHFDYPVLSPQELLWNALVYATPTRLLLDADKRHELRANDLLSQTHAAKSEAMRRMLGLGTSSLTHKLSGGEGIVPKMGMFSSNEATSTDAPPGLGNWDNSCYQNSVLQGLASLQSLNGYLDWARISTDDSGSTSVSLRETVAKLNDASNNGRQLWTPAKLKNMSSWQQQDAQEYFSKIMDELDKEAATEVSVQKAEFGLETAVKTKEVAANAQTKVAVEEQDRETSGLRRNPMEGLLAQRVACTRCGFSEGLSMIPFNCLTVPLGSDNAYDLEECLDEYTKLEEINEVDCVKCTLLRAESQLKQMLPVTEQSAKQDNPENAKEKSPRPAIGLPPEVRVLVVKRLEAIQQALENDDFADKTLNETCQIPKKAHVSSTKTRQAVIGRAPLSLVVHVNRSVFDELTGVQRKNYATVRYPMLLDLGMWALGDECSRASAMQSLLAGEAGSTLYRLNAVVTHHGRHSNGHYISYRRHPVKPAQDGDVVDGGEGQDVVEKWWRLSDEDVSAVTEGDVLARGDAFMLFYEREDAPRVFDTRAPSLVIVDQQATEDALASASLLEEAAAVPLPTEDEPDSENETQPLTPAATAELPPLARPTATPSAPSKQDTQNLPPMADPFVHSENSVDHSETATTAVERTQKTPTPPLMRTSHRRRQSRQSSRSDVGFGNAFRPMATT
ncbi:hypothetical protein LTR08_000284 [Meristemomyces frigidus]|nr:hypothetical protein LTR08_000284 [Meristemomyces frigidus]